ncbi:flagellar protein [Campylobacter sp. CCS1377]|uniref:Flagellar protein n=1 Tax=Campylobacter sp. CCS1377 TaxID=3158229 RepID=A0AAU7E9B6_9BACT
MRVLILICISFIYLFGFDLVLNTGRENNSTFAILHLKNDKEFSCKELVVDGKSHFQCDILGNIEREFQNQKFDYFDLEFKKQNDNLQILIYPKIEAKMYILDPELYAKTDVKNTKNINTSKNFTFVFSEKIDFVDERDGLNFDIKFPHEILPSIGALDLESNPVVIPQSADINTYVRIKNEYEKSNYLQVISDAQNAINRYSGSIFMSEFILYKLRAQNKLYTYNDEDKDQAVLEAMLEESKNWMRTFTSDKNFPEILYLSMRAYMGLSQKNNVDYVIGILKNEHAGNYFSELALLDYAEYLYHLGKKEEGMLLNEQIYYQSQNKDLASRAGAFLAKYYIEKKDYSKAISFINLIFEANPAYFVQDKNRALDLAELLSMHKLYNLSSAIYEKVFLDLKTIDPEYEKTLKNLALDLSQTARHQDAKKYLDLYVEEFMDGEFITEIKEASDRIFFDTADNNSTLLHERYTQLREQYNNEISQRALSEDVKLYFNEGNYSKVLEFKDLIDQSQNPDDKGYLSKAAINSLNAELSKDECIKATDLYLRFESYGIIQGIDGKKHMLECLLRTSKIDKAKEYIEKNYNEDSIYYGLQKANLLLDDKKYQQVLDLSTQILNSRILKSDEEKFKALKLKFLAYLRMDDYNNAIKSLMRLEKFPMNYEMVELYNEFVTYCKDKNLQTSILTYATKAIDYQNLKGVNLFSPQLEFTYLDALYKAQRYDEALLVLKDLIKIKNLNADEKARIFYTQALVYEKLANLNAQKQSLQQCLDLNSTSNWKNLCQDKNQLLIDKNL